MQVHPRGAHKKGSRHVHLSPFPRAHRPPRPGRAHEEIALRHADDSERGRTLAPPVVDALRASGLIKMCAPREVGGAEIDPLTHLEIAEAAARIDTATAWSLSINAYSAACAGAYLPDAGVERVFQRGFPFVAGALLPAGVARRVPGGYVIRGR
ncbi:acyl-CoA dehydrogenase family protein [Sorangium sp. So ce269]